MPAQKQQAASMTWPERFGFLISVTVICFGVVTLFSLVFGPAGGAP